MRWRVSSVNWFTTVSSTEPNNFLPTINISKSSNKDKYQIKTNKKAFLILFSPAMHWFIRSKNIGHRNCRFFYFFSIIFQSNLLTRNTRLYHSFLSFDFFINNQFTGTQSFIHFFSSTFSFLFQFGHWHAKISVMCNVLLVVTRGNKLD